MKRLFVILSALIWCTGSVWADVTLEDVSQLINASQINASTIAWGDFNADGQPDLFVGDGGTNGSQIFLNNSRSFSEGNLSYDASQLTNVRTVQLVDYNNDGRLDIFCLTNDDYGARLFRLTSARRFQEVSLLPSVLHGELIRSAAWTDLDEDGRLDILLSNTRAEPYVTLLKQEISEFIELRGGVLPPYLRSSGAVCAVDFDNDSDLDIFLGASPRAMAKLYRNDGGHYRPWGESAGLPKLCGWTGAAWMDYDNDQFLDLVTSDRNGNNFLLRSEPLQDSRGFSNQNQMPGFDRGMKYARYVDAADINGDGWQDLLVLCEGVREPKLMLNQAGASWQAQPIIAPDGLHPTVATQACALADFDLDGAIDIALAIGEEGVKLYRNATEIEHEWIGISLVYPVTMAPVLDAQILMTFQNSKQMATTSAASSIPGCNYRTVMLYSSDPDKSEEAGLLVHWPNGIDREYAFADLALNAVNKFVCPTTVPHPVIEPVLPPDVEVELTSAPNPFNPTTTINFVLPENGNVRLAVYNVLGREVAVLADAPYEAGSHSLTFNAADLPSGLYIARLSAASENKLHRLLLVK